MIMTTPMMMVAAAAVLLTLLLAGLVGMHFGKIRGRKAAEKESITKVELTKAVAETERSRAATLIAEKKKGWAREQLMNADMPLELEKYLRDWVYLAKILCLLEGAGGCVRPVDVKARAAFESLELALMEQHKFLEKKAKGSLISMP